MNINTIGICGAGTMGAGIAQVFAQFGFETTLFDIHTEQLNKAKNSIHHSWSIAVAKGKLSPQQQSEAEQKISFTTELNEVKGDLIIEAIVEKIEPKQELFISLSRVNNDKTIFASNTSSLSITQIAAKVPQPERFAGIHFFNPAPVMKLVEVVSGINTDKSILSTLIALVRAIGKNPVVCKDSPGFIVNRVARHYYLESLKILEEQAASIENIDTLLESAGFKMGAFKLMDLIGNDINYAVTTSLFHAFNGEAKFRPSRIQEQKVNANQLGKKTGKGFYNYQ